MGCNAEDSCPVALLPKLENWDLDNPKGKPIDEYRRIRNKIEPKVRVLLEEY